MSSCVKEGERIPNPQVATAPKHKRMFHIFTNEFILNSNSKSHSKYSTNSHNSNNSNKKSTIKSSGLTPKPKSFKNFCFDRHISLLNSRFKSSLKNSIINSKELELLHKKIKILEAEELKAENSLCKSQELQRKKNKARIANIKQKSLIQNFMKLKEKEMQQKKDKVKSLRDKENDLIIKNKQHRKIHSENIAEKKNKMKKKILEDLSKEKDKINEENKRKIGIIKKMDEDIMKRKKENERRKKKIMMEQLEQEIKIQEEFNRKLMSKINKFQKIGFMKITRLVNIK
jgi:hypothetical protein